MLHAAMCVQFHSIRILLLEDSELDALLIEAELRRNTVVYELKRVENETEFTTALREFHPQIVFTDYMLPSFDGAAALRLVRRDYPELPVIVISGAVGEETAVELLKAGATDFVLKSRLFRLESALKRALREVEERAALAEAQAALSTCNMELEQRVRDRTLELSQKNAIMEEDLKMAHELQVALLPSHFPTIPRGCPQAESAVRICSHYRSSHLVGGDCFNVLQVSENALSVLISDVMGHGVRAALVTAMLRALEEQLGEKAADPGLLLTEMNKALCHIFKDTDTLVFASACCLTVDLKAGSVTFANAGHPTPLLVHRARKSVEPLCSHTEERGPALGIFEETTYANDTLPLAADDLILLFTDGLFEVENSREELFSEGRLLEAVARHTDLGPEPLLHAVVEDVEQFTEGRAFSDDVCVVGVHVAKLPYHAA